MKREREQEEAAEKGAKKLGELKRDQEFKIKEHQILVLFSSLFFIFVIFMGCFYGCVEYFYNMLG